MPGNRLADSRQQLIERLFESSEISTIPEKTAHQDDGARLVFANDRRLATKDYF